MSEQTENRILTEMECMQNRAYILNDPLYFSLTGYRVLQTNEKKCFVKCTRLLYNGKIKIVFFSAQYISLEELLVKISPDNFLNVAANLLRAVMEVQGNGFLNSANIDISPDRIFVDPNTLEVRIICLPLNSMNVHKKQAEFQSELRVMLYQIIESYSQLSINAKISDIRHVLLSGTTTLQDLYSCFAGKANSGFGYADPPPDDDLGKKDVVPSPQQPPLVLRGTSFADLYFMVTKNRFRLGRKEDNDGIVDKTKAVSRSHCAISYRDGRYYVIDLNSTHGTYIRKSRNDDYSERLQPNKEIPLMNDSYLKIADVEFHVKY